MNELTAKGSGWPRIMPTTTPTTTYAHPPSLPSPNPIAIFYILQYGHARSGAPKAVV